MQGCKVRKKMKRVLFIICITLFLTNANAISPDFIKKMSYETEYEKALNKAKKENKNVMMVVSQQSCPWCRKMEKQTLQKEPIDKLIKKSFIPLLVDKDSNSFPKKFEAKLFPTTIFIDTRKETEITKVLGYKDKNEFKAILEELIK
ncbi:hypothetical protein CRV08_10490 [Halarcobacter ebronensis]|uniref:Thioredoxin domain-containing protein n=2 Tax=Halarcobacter ebronensis TaxID=1462615 RepID=A0A4Q0YAJ2_9BACT|nr:hypothetical protein CRV08_10490 [Halarcobacter ebronensis]